MAGTQARTGGSLLTAEDQPGDLGPVLTLQQLIEARFGGQGVDNAALEELTAGRISRQSWSNYRAGRMREFPKPRTIPVLAEALGVDNATVLLACAASADVDVRRSGSMLGHLLPAGTDHLSDDVRDAVLALVRVLVAEALQREGGGEDGQERAFGELPRLTRTIEWPKRGTADRRNTAQ